MVFTIQATSDCPFHVNTDDAAQLTPQKVFQLTLRDPCCENIADIVVCQKGT